MTSGIGILIDGVVAILLTLTIGYCMLLNRKLKLLKADEHSLRATISELVTATEIAERAIGGLKLTVHECDMGLGERLRKAERTGIELDRALVEGRDLIERLTKIAAVRRPAEDAGAARKSVPPSVAPAPEAQRADAKAVAAAAEAFAERLRMKVHGLAA